MATVTVRRKPTYAELEAKVKELQDALVIAEKNRCLRDIGWDMLHNQIETLERENRGLQMKVEQKDRLIAELNDQIEASEREAVSMAAEIDELKADRNIAIAESARLRAGIAEKDKTNDLAVRATDELAKMLVKANEDKEAMLDEIGELNTELMERECRIDELEKQVEWLRSKNEEWAKVAADQKDTIVNYEAVITDLQKDVTMWRTAADTNIALAKETQDALDELAMERDKLRQAVDEISEQSADFCAKAQYEEERAEALDAANQKLYAQVLGQRDAMDHLQRQLKANEQEYIRVQGMYDELYAAANAMVHVVRK